MKRKPSKTSNAQIVREMDDPASTGLENEYFHCSWEWHIAQLSSVCALIYPFAFKLSGGVETPLPERRLFASAQALASYFGYSECQVRRGLIELCEHGLLQVVSKKKFKPTNYRVLSHDDWASKFSGRCTAKVEYPWTGEGDPLGRSLWRLSGGQVRFAEFQVVNLRRLGLSDQEIMDRFSVHWDHHGQRMNPRNVPAGFYMHLRGSGTT